MALAACGPSPDQRIQEIKNVSRLDERQKKFLLEKLPEESAHEDQEAKDRQKLVLPKPVGWRPEPVAQKLKLVLVPERTRLRRGERFYYRLEMQNMGQEPVFFYEPWDGFVKWGTLSRPYSFWVTCPDGIRINLDSRAYFDESVKFQELDGLGSLDTLAQLENANMRIRARYELWLNLEPGETLRTAWEMTFWDMMHWGVKDWEGSAPRRQFRDLRTRFAFDESGVYSILVVRDDPAAGGRTESNVVRVEVVP
jgi:hypothetical protein